MPRAKKNTFNTNGVYITPAEYSEGDRVRITYDGLLAKSGASDMYAHIGYGTKKWNDIMDLRMSKTEAGFEAIFPVSSSSPLNVVFKDSADNWDNNSGSNYSFKANK